MTAVTPEQDSDVRRVVRSIHDGLHVPEGYRAEITQGRIRVSASPDTRHVLIVDAVRAALRDKLPDGYRAYENITLEEPGGDRYIPDLAAWPRELVRDSGEQWVLSAQGCGFVLEVTSPDRESHDYAKADGYARGGVPVYLLVDRSKRECVAYSTPLTGTYRTTTVFKFGETVIFTVPGGSETRIDTSDF